MTNGSGAVAQRVFSFYLVLSLAAVQGAMAQANPDGSSPPAVTAPASAPDKDAPAVTGTTTQAGTIGGTYTTPRLTRGWTPPPRWRFVINNLLLARYNPLGLEDQIRVGGQYRLYEHESGVLRENFLFLGFYPKINPAYAKLGPSLEIQPVSVFNLRVAAEWMTFFKTFGYLQSFNSPNANWSDTQIEHNTDAMQNYKTSGVHVMVEPTLQFRLDVGKLSDGTPRYGQIAVRDKAAFEYWNMNVHAGDTVFYDATLDTLVPANGWVFQNDLDVVFVTRFRLTAGLRYTVVHPFYAPSAFQGAADAAAYNGRNQTQRVGPIVAYTFYDRGYTRFNKPTILVILNWWAEHPYRTGEDVSQAIPYFIAAFSFQSDLVQ